MHLEFFGPIFTRDAHMRSSPTLSFRLTKLETLDLGLQMDHRLHMVDMSGGEKGPQEVVFACRERCSGECQTVFPDGTLLLSWPLSMKHTWMLLTQHICKKLYLVTLNGSPYGESFKVVPALTGYLARISESSCFPRDTTKKPSAMLHLTLKDHPKPSLLIILDSLKK